MGGVFFVEPTAFLKHGVLNSVLVAQVRNTAPWLWAAPSCAALVAIFDTAVDEPLDGVHALERAFRLRLAAHYATVATFVPTDVDAHLRHHVWLSVANTAAFEPTLPATAASFCSPER